MGLILPGWLLSGEWRVRFSRIQALPSLLLPLGLVLIYSLATLGGPGAPLAALLPLALIPLCIGTAPQLPFWRLAQVFVAACALVGLLCLGHAAWRTLAEGTFRMDYFQYIELGKWLDLHPAYISMQLNLACLLLVCLASQPGYALPKWATYAGLAFFFILILLFESRMQILILLGMAAGGLGFLAIKHRRIWQTAGLLALVFASALLFMAADSGTRGRMMDLVEQKELPVRKLNNSGTAVRRYIWGHTKEIAFEHPAGIGAGRFQQELDRRYRQDGFPNVGMNAHNQYLETAATAGIAGLILLLGVVVWPIVFCIRRGQWLYAGGMAVIALSLLTESMLQRQMGLMTLAFFYGLFLYQASQTTPTAPEYHFS
ncbi:MAG: O-antigen ligase domain-containing protein [Bacteroidetes bacterium]|nr:MAG: O-antigen ligase domain-containing protein [Bacteroidota bacterium]